MKKPHCNYITDDLYYIPEEWRLVHQNQKSVNTEVNETNVIHYLSIIDYYNMQPITLFSSMAIGIILYIRYKHLKKIKEKPTFKGNNIKHSKSEPIIHYNEYEQYVIVDNIEDNSSESEPEIPNN